MGVVVAATHLMLGHQVAIKCLLPSAQLDDETIARFFREARVTARLKSNHIAKTVDMGQLDDGRPFLVMDLLEGRDLDAAIEAGKPLPIDVVVGWLLQACEGIAEAHRAGIVHRDLKPSNLFLARDASGEDVVKVLDFGISKLTGDPDHALTKSEASFGSPLYMSPEQLRSSKSADARSDVWSLGVILYEALCGRPPFQGENVFGLANAVMFDPPEPPIERRSDIPRELSALIVQCLSKAPAARPQSVADLSDRLAPFAGQSGRERAMRVRNSFAPESGRLAVAAEPSEHLAAAATQRNRPGRVSLVRWPVAFGVVVLLASIGGLVALGVTRSSNPASPAETSLADGSLTFTPPTIASGGVPIASETVPVVTMATTTAPATPSVTLVVAVSPSSQRGKAPRGVPSTRTPATPSASATPAPTNTGPFIDRRTD
ncbi:putative serine/threonine protein kinase [Labilithrix luteola]|uniref:Putative serine/threonine protein kinase n=2 Tax=Labilithrix luteola TaxID=1391654 RepID=A0A0K1PR18_9BACT|nr:putative serine/threonine protein kinase [Labilithrix luteola]